MPEPVPHADSKTAFPIAARGLPTLPAVPSWKPARSCPATFASPCRIPLVQSERVSIGIWAVSHPEILVSASPIPLSYTTEGETPWLHPAGTDAPTADR